MEQQKNHLKPGHTLMNGEIEILDVLGSGSFGQVYRGIWHRKDGHQTVAIKCFDSRAMREKDVIAIKMIHRESLLISAIQHPAIVKVLAVKLDDHMQYIVEEYLPGGNLQLLLAERRADTTDGSPLMSALEITNLGMQLAQALDSVHSRGIYHGDLKPSNICFRDLEQQELVLVDFGHGGFYDDNMLDLQHTAGTLAYLSPERTGFVKFAGNVESELYSLGALLYEACAGVPLFKTKDAQEFINLLLRQVPTPLHKIFPEIPEPLSDIIQKLLRKQPGQRYCSAMGLYADLERCHINLRKGQPLASFALGTRDKVRELNYKIPIIGRQAELTMLRESFDRAAAGDGSAILIGAPSGTGKSRLAFELLKRAQDFDASITSVKFSEFERNLPLSALGILLLDHANSLQMHAESSIRQWQERLLKELGSAGSLLNKRFDFYAEWLPDFPVLKSLEREQETHLFNETLARFLALLSVEGKVQVLLMDDLQWADAQSLAVLRELCMLGQDKKIGSTLLVGTYRTNEVKSGHPLDAILKTCILPRQLLLLNPLLREESDQLISCLLDEEGPEVARLQHLTYKLTEGNPFFIYEYLKAAIVSGLFAMRESDLTWHLNEEKTASMSFHEGVAGLVSERIEKLESLPRHLMQAASIVSNAISLETLITLLGVLEPEIAAASEEDALQRIRGVHDELVQKHLVLPHEERFVFFHDKIREASLALLTPDLKKQLHSCYAQNMGRELLQSAKGGRDKDLFEASWHVMQGSPEGFPHLARRILLSAAQSAKGIFAYSKARDYLAFASQLYEDDYRKYPDQLKEWLSVHELWADTLAVSDRVHDALVLYDRVLEHVTEPMLKAEIFGKKTECYLTLFNYADCMTAAIKGLEAIGEKIIVQEWKAYLYLFTRAPLLMVSALWFWMFGKQTKEIKTKEQEIRFQLLLAVEVPLYFNIPILAIANLIPITRELLPYKANQFRALTMGYWGAALNPFGFAKAGGKFFSLACDYFDQHADPIRRSIVLFQWSYVHDFNAGKIKEANFKFTEACRDLAAVGESYWRSLSLQGLLHLGYYGSENTDANLTVSELKELWKRLQYAPTMLGCTLRNYLHEQHDEQLENTMTLIREAESSMKTQGINSLDAIFARAAQGEIHLLKGDYNKADAFLADAFRFCLLKHHRIAYCLYIPILYTKNLVHQRRFLRALGVLFVCWFNQAAKVRIFLPQTLYVSGEFLHALGLHRLGLRFVHHGIRAANKFGWRSIVAEGRLLVGTLLSQGSQEEAEIYLRLAQKYFKERSWRFFEDQCERLLVDLHLKHQEQTSIQNGLDITQTQSAGAFQIRQKMETQALLEIFLRLSSLGQQDDLLEALMESLGNCTGADLAIIFMLDSEIWMPYKAMNCELSELQSQGYARLGIDKGFFDECLQSGKAEPMIRSPHWNRDNPAHSGSVLVLPLAYGNRIYAYCYLANRTITDLFDARTSETVQPIATQAAITLQSIQLATDLKHLNRTLEDQVEEQTREIKSILANLPLGVMVIEGHAGLLHKTYSLYLETLLNTSDLAGRRALDILIADSNISADERNQIEASLNSMLDEDSLNFDVNAHILPRSLIRQNSDGSQSFWDLSWQAILDKESLVEKMLVVISDVTDLIRHQKVAEERAYELDLISEILASPADAFIRFIKSAQAFQLENNRLLIDYAGELQTCQHIFINLHTVKGAARTLRLKHLTETLHQIEQGYANQIKNPTAAWSLETKLQEMQNLQRQIQEYQDVAEQKLGRTLGATTQITLALRDVKALVDDVDLALKKLDSSAQAPLHRVHEMLMSTLATPLSRLSEQFFQGLELLAADLGKATPKVEIKVPTLYLESHIEEVLRMAFTHLIRNSLDHGLEKVPERRLLKKADSGTLKLHGSILGEQLVLRFFDDGRGLAVAKLRRMGLEKGLLSAEESKNIQSVAQLIFASGFSTADQLSDISGRGIGMSAVRQLLQEAGGGIDLELASVSSAEADFIPFAFIIRLPLPNAKWLRQESVA